MDQGRGRNTVLTLPHLVPVPENRVALAAIERLAGWFGAGCLTPPVEPLFLHGPPGAGKSHLVAALAAEVRRQAPGTSFALLNGGDFRSSWQGAHEGAPLREDAVTADLLLLEDLQHFPPQAAETLTQLLDERKEHDRPTVVTATVSPWQLLDLPARLVSRLAAGLVVGLAPLSAPSRLAVLQRKAQQRQFAVPADVLVWLADHLHGNGRQLLAALDRLEQYARSRPLPPDVPAVAELFRTQVEQARPTLERVVKRVSSYFQVEARHLQSRRRSHKVLLPRQVGMYLARQLTGLSLSAIGAHFGGRDHSTVLHACQKVQAALDRDATLAGAVRALQSDLL